MRNMYGPVVEKTVTESVHPSGVFAGTPPLSAYRVAATFWPKTRVPCSDHRISEIGG